MLKQLFSILLISSLIGPYLGISIYLKHEKRMLKREIKHRIIEGIDRSELVELSFTPQEEKQLIWKHSKEFEFKGEMYDVVETEVINGQTVYWCWWDNKETTLNKQLNSMLAKALGQNYPDSGQQTISNFLKLLYCPVPDLFSFERSLSEKKSAFFNSIFYYPPALLNLVKPPESSLTL